MSQSEVFERSTKPLFGPDVLWAANLSRRNQQFRQMAYGLRTARLKSYVPMIERETRIFLKSWGQSVRKKQNWRRLPDTVGLCRSRSLFFCLLYV